MELYSKLQYQTKDLRGISQNSYKRFEATPPLNLHFKLLPRILRDQCSVCLIMHVAMTLAGRWRTLQWMVDKLDWFAQLAPSRYVNGSNPCRYVFFVFFNCCFYLSSQWPTYLFTCIWPPQAVSRNCFWLL